MQVPLQISFHNVDHSDAVEERVRERAEKLEQFHHQIISCRVVIESPHKHQSQGTMYNVRVDVKIPGHEFIHKGDKGDHAHEDAYVAVRDAFDSVERQVRKYNERNNKGSAQRHKAAAVAE